MKPCYLKRRLMSRRVVVQLGCRMVGRDHVLLYGHVVKGREWL